MTIKIKHDKGTDTITLPDNWQQVTWLQMAELRKGANPFEVFTKIPLEGWNHKGATKAYIKLNHLLSWARATPDWDTSDFKMIVGGREINFKSVKLQTESIGQYLDIEHIISEFGKKKKKDADLTKLYPVMIAVYADKVINGGYDYNRAMKLTEGIKGQPYQKVNNIGGFFFTNMTVFKGGGNLLWLLWIYLKRRLWPAFPLLTISTKAWQH